MSLTARIVAALLACPLLAQTAAAAKDLPRDKLRAEEFFAHGAIPELRLQLDEASQEQLRKEPRSYVKATLAEGARELGVVGVKLKGAAGSFQEFDQRPALTINTDKFTPELSFHGLVKFHLNNSVQDDSLLCEWLGSEVFRAAGQAACRVTHARVRLCGRDLGLYVFKEGFDARFLERNFGSSQGSLYDGGFCQEIDAELEKDVGDASTRADLQALAAACKVRDAAERQRQLRATLDLEAFVTFAALERMLVHWDGYVQTRNNYRLWFDATGHGRFLPHGMDQLLGDVEATVLTTPESLVGAAVLRLPEWRARYRARLLELLPVLRGADLQKRLGATAARVQKQLHADGTGDEYRERARDLQQRFDARIQKLERQLRAPEPRTIELAVGKAQALTEWLATRTTENAELKTVAVDGARAFRIGSADQQPCSGSWRCSVLLAPGRYRFEARARTKDVVGGEDGGGVLLRRSGATAEQEFGGTQPAQVLGYEFTVDDAAEVVLVAELRAASGQVWFRRDAMRIVRLPD